MQDTNLDAAPTESVRYSFRAAYGANAFHQFQLIDASKLSREARERGIRISLSGDEPRPRRLANGSVRDEVARTVYGLDG